MLSKLLLLVLGLVMVVPRLAWRPWPRLNGVPAVGVPGDDGVRAGEPAGEAAPSEIACLRASAETGCDGSCAPFSAGVCGREPEMIALPSSESASYRSGGRRSFSISDFRLHRHQVRNAHGR